MKLREVKIKNFRSLVDVVIPLDDLTVLIGENNSGKTSFLEALNIVLGRNSAGRDIPFDEYDYHMFELNHSPESSDGIVIEIWFREDQSSEWPEPLVQVLHEIIQTDPRLDIDSIGMRLSSKFNLESGEFDTVWEFLNSTGQPLARVRSSTFIALLLRYVYLFYLSALRDSRDFFSSRSAFWGRILRTLKIDDVQRDEIYEKLGEVNEILLKADSRLEDVRNVLDELQRVMEPSARQITSIRALPMKIWDLMSRSEVTIKGRGGDVDFPLARHGQGTQSLSVLSVFQAYVEVFLKPSFESETEAIFTIEEPEAHLHPQVTRALAATIQRLSGQKIISSHSPFFIQEVPLTNIRMFSRKGATSKVLYIKRDFGTQVPQNSQIGKFCSKPTNVSKYTYDTQSSSLVVSGCMKQNEYRELLQVYPGQPEIHERLKSLYNESQLFLSNEELSNLEVYVKRIRGEILFARGWLLCEGQSEYILVRHFAKLLGISLDEQGISVIDFQNNGSPGAFVSLARAFEIPWVMMCDGDAAGNDFISQVKHRGVEDPEIALRVTQLGVGEDLELFLVNHGFVSECAAIITAKGVSLSIAIGQPDYEAKLADELRKDKIGCASALVEQLDRCGADGTRVPTEIKALMNALLGEIS